MHLCIGKVARSYESGSDVMLFRRQYILDLNPTAQAKNSRHVRSAPANVFVGFYIAAGAFVSAQVNQ